eukprot:214762-Pyramimonas_sp.AAC.1
MRGTNVQNASYQRCEHPGQLRGALDIGTVGAGSVAGCAVEQERRGPERTSRVLQNSQLRV